MWALIIASINEKGGVGKSTTVFNLAGYFAHCASRVLIVEMDPQGTISQGFFGSESTENLAKDKTIAAIFDEHRMAPSPQNLIVPTAFDRIFVIRANNFLKPYNTPEPEKMKERQHLLAQYLGEIRSQFDVIFIDCPPNLYLLSWNALLAADYVIVPVPPEAPATQGIRHVHEDIRAAQRINYRLQLLGHLIIRKDRRIYLHRKYHEELKTLYGSTVFEQAVSESAAIKVAYELGSPISYSDPQSAAGQAIEKVGDELMERIEVALENEKAAV